MTSLHVICGLSLPNQNSGYAYKLEIAWKTFLKTFFLENTCGCVLDPWPRQGLSLERLSLPLASDFFVSLSLASSFVTLLIVTCYIVNDILSFFMFYDKLKFMPVTV